MALQRLLKNEFQLKNFWYSHRDPSDFWRYQWICWTAEHIILKTIPAVYAVYAWIHTVVYYHSVAVDHSDGLPANVTEEERDGLPFDWDTRRPWCAYLSLWAFTLLMVHLVLSATLAYIFVLGNPRNTSEHKYLLDTSYRFSSQDVDGGELVIKPAARSSAQDSGPGTKASSRPNPPLAWYFKLSWILGDISTPMAPIITILFFAGMYHGETLDVFHLNMFIMNTVLIIMDTNASARPIRLLHFVTPLLFWVVYVLFNLIFWTFDHTQHVLYPDLMDWNKPGHAIMVAILVGVIGIPLSMLVWFIVYRVKIAICNWRYKDKAEYTPQ